MKAVVDRIVQYANRYKLTNVETGEVLGTFDFDEVTGTVQQVGTEIDKELFDSIANDLAARVKLSGGELAGTIVTFSDISGTAANVASGDTSATLWGKVKNWFSRLKALAFKNKVAAGDFETGAIKDADVAADAAIAQGKVSGLMTDYVASISVSGRTVTYKNKNGANMGSITTQDTTYGLASQSSNGLMSSTDKTKLDGIESGAQKNTVLGVKGSSESGYRTGNVNITKANIGLGNVDNTSDADKPVSTATQTALNGKANTSGTYPNMTVGKATADASGNVIPDTYAKLSQVVRTDVAQSLTDEEKARAKDNLVIQTTKVHSPSTTKGWYRVAKLNRQSAYSVTIGQEYNYIEPMNIKLALNLGYQNAIITQESGIISSSLPIDRVRVCVGTTTDAFFDVHTPPVHFNITKISIDRLYNSDGAVAIETYDDWEYLGTDDTVSGYNVTRLDLVSGTNTSGQVYQQGSPVLVGDQSAIFESDGVTVKKAAKATQDADGNVIPDTYATKAEATRTATYTQQGQVKMGSTTNGGNITSGDSDDVVPTIKNICNWTKENFLPIGTPQWVTDKIGSLVLPSAGWYICRYKFYYSAIFYFEKGYDLAMIYPFANGYISILQQGTISRVEINGISQTGDISYYKLG